MAVFACEAHPCRRPAKLVEQGHTGIYRRRTSMPRGSRPEKKSPRLRRSSRCFNSIHVTHHSHQTPCRPPSHPNPNSGGPADGGPRDVSPHRLFGVSTFPEPTASAAAETQPAPGKFNIACQNRSSEGRETAARRPTAQPHLHGRMGLDVWKSNRCNGPAEGDGACIGRCGPS